MLTKEQEEILIGALLGDASIEYNGSSCRIRFDYSIKVRDYVYWLAEKLLPYSGKVTEYAAYDKRTKKVNKKIRFYTSTNSIFDKYRDMFYTGLNGEKDTVPPNIKDLLSSKLTLAVWFLDDGALRTDSNAYRIHTECFPLESVKELIGALRSNFAIESKEHNHRNAATKLAAEKGYLIHIGSKGGHAKKLNELIKDFVASEIPIMLYKFF